MVMNIVSVTYLKFLFKWVRVSLNYAIIMQNFWPWSAYNLHEAYEAEFYKPTVFNVNPPVFRTTAYATMPGRLDPTVISFCSKLLIQKNGGLNPRSHNHESTTLRITRQQQLVANIGLMFDALLLCQCVLLDFYQDQ